MSTMGSRRESSRTSSAASTASRCSWRPRGAIRQREFDGEVGHVGTLPVRSARPDCRWSGGARVDSSVAPGAPSRAAPGPALRLDRLGPDRPAGTVPCGRTRPSAATSTEQWHVIDAEGAILGRLATEVATLLRGKHKPIFAPHIDTGDHVIVVNAAGSRSSPARGTTSSTTATPATPAGSAPRVSTSCSRATPSASCGSRCSACCRRARSAGRC